MELVLSKSSFDIEHVGWGQTVDYESIIESVFLHICRDFRNFVAWFVEIG